MQDDLLTDTADPHLDTWFGIPVPMVKEVHAEKHLDARHGLVRVYLWTPSKTGEEHLNVIDEYQCTGITIQALYIVSIWMVDITIPSWNLLQIHLIPQTSQPTNRNIQDMFFSPPQYLLKISTLMLRVKIRVRLFVAFYPVVRDNRHVRRTHQYLAQEFDAMVYDMALVRPFVLQTVRMG
jgi:hypothetical protein